MFLPSTIFLKCCEKLKQRKKGEEAIHSLNFVEKHILRRLLFLLSQRICVEHKNYGKL